MVAPSTTSELNEERRTLHEAVAPMLKRLLDGEVVFRPARPASTASPVRGAAARAGGASDVAALGGLWPVGPGQGNGAITPAVLEGLFTRLCGEPLSSGSDDVSTDITLRRLNLLLGDRHNEHSRAVLLWLDAAGLLEAPADPAQPWAAPRRLVTNDAAAIAMKLREAPLPDPAAVEQAKRTMKK
jgi:hypothetical protein